MRWNPFEILKQRFKKAAAPPAAGGAPPPAPLKPEPGPKAGPELPQDLKDLEKQGLLSKFFRHWKDPALLRQVKGVVGRMQAEGVNVKDKKAVQDWLKAHQAEIESGKAAEGAPPAKPQTFVKTGPEVGRNDPCPCGSGKKYKKCCAAKGEGAG